jgi:hypothetical protein
MPSPRNHNVPTIALYRNGIQQTSATGDGVSATTANHSKVGTLMRARMRELGLSYGAVARVVAEATHGGPPVSDTAVLKWLSHPERLEPTRMFALEHALQVPPGTYTRELGYVPADQPTGLPEDALRSDERLTERDRTILLAALYSALRTP